MPRCDMSKSGILVQRVKPRRCYRTLTPSINPRVTPCPKRSETVGQHSFKSRRGHVNNHMNACFGLTATSGKGGLTSPPRSLASEENGVRPKMPLYLQKGRRAFLRHWFFVPSLQMKDPFFGKEPCCAASNGFGAVRCRSFVSFLLFSRGEVYPEQHSCQAVPMGYISVFPSQPFLSLRS